MLDYFKVSVSSMILCLNHRLMALQGLMTPYMSFLVQPFIGILDAFPTDTTIDTELWTCVIETLTASLNVDEGRMYYSTT